MWLFAKRAGMAQAHRAWKELKRCRHITKPTGPSMLQGFQTCPTLSLSHTHPPALRVGHQVRSWS